ncbi:aminotransferase class V-fold PLP-dependent enzyme [Humisphaera borealis]|uniref:Aminotransferase class V-fold PLP-dependent enzyme n=1 Tax=Humisphaera borealis TaxID=2807512 RepID=A0A7M2WRU9_9BACT|nr:aminotransferase class V-fold PLP-dependent enzyme [Humisphaera borealis]QOV87994.1 aminotransferase class V-fold PLP-dependent enzyme [Humisphaera borealis]
MFGEIRQLIGNSEAFPVLKNWTFFNHAGVCPLPAAAADAFRKYAGQAEERAYLFTGWYQDIEKLRHIAAELIGAHRDEIAFIKNTSEGLSIVANGIDWQWGDRIVTTAVEYPANVYPWMEQVRNRGVKLVTVPEIDDENGRRCVPVDRILQEAADERTRIVSLSHVEYASGQRHDLTKIGEFCRANNKLFCVDAIQTVGALPVDVKAMKIDYLSADGHKWMLGPEGAGIFYCRKELIERTRPIMVGWMNVVDAQNYGDINYTLRSDAQRFECGTYNVPGLLSLKAALELIQTARLGHVAQRIRELTDLMIEMLSKKGYQIVSPRDKWQWSGIVSFTSPRHEHKRLVAELRKEKKIEIALREGRLRASPHFYNTEDQVARLVEALPAH